MKSKHNSKRKANQKVFFCRQSLPVIPKHLASGFDVAPGARASGPIPHHETRPRETESRRTFPLNAIALRSPSGGGGGGAGGCGGFPTTINAGAIAGRGSHGTTVKSVSAAQVSRRVQGGEPWEVGVGVVLRRAVFSRAVSLVPPNNCTGSMGDSI